MKDETLLDALFKALALNLDSNFIHLLKQEADRRDILLNQSCKLSSAPKFKQEGKLM
ncbi:sporulation histidine kinase inhibitor Sda [Thalassobacillus sp. C254]|uniref:sporulation histidine kinase inhibitor Sda n=1 Tax=Thalassobacillus sp. C254 TaxID=1225341 RepID=UPI0018DBAC46|nr:sporulation histidine kinase inhibitor Sda [Thalassobacillus sp. C254]